jgi:hypothetical protein
VATISTVAEEKPQAEAVIWPNDCGKVSSAKYLQPSKKDVFLRALFA